MKRDPMPGYYLASQAHKNRLSPIQRLSRSAAWFAAFCFIFGLLLGLLLGAR